jgi:hypothetical protein
MSADEILEKNIAELTKKKNLKRLVTITQKLNEFRQEVTQINTVVSQVKAFFSSPFVTAANVIFGQSIAGTTDSTARLMVKLLERVEDPQTQFYIRSATLVINAISLNISNILDSAPSTEEVEDKLSLLFNVLFGEFIAHLKILAGEYTVSIGSMEQLVKNLKEDIETGGMGDLPVETGVTPGGDDQQFISKGGLS